MAKPSKKSAKSEAEVAAEAKRKKEILDQVAQSNLPTKTILKELGISRSTYYSWLKRYEEEGEEGLLDSRSLPKTEQELREAAPAIEEAEPQVTEVEPAAAVVEETPPGPEAETVAATEPTPLAAEEADAAPKGPVAAPMKEKPKEKPEVVMASRGTPPFDGGEKKKGYGIYALIAALLLILGLLFSVSLSHYNTYELRLTGNTLTLWKGKFAARGFEMLEEFEPLQVGDSDVSALTNRTFTGEDELNRAVYAFLMDQINTELAKGNEADSAKIDLLLAKAANIVGADAKNSRSLADIRYQLAEKQVAIAEMELKKAYEKAIPVYEEAAGMGLGDAALVQAKIKAMQAALRGVPQEAVEGAPADEAAPATAPEAAGEGAVTPVEPQEPAKEAVTPALPEESAKAVGDSAATQTIGQKAGKAAAPEPTPEAAETTEAPTE